MRIQDTPLQSLYLQEDVGEAAGKMFKSGRLEISEGRPEHRFKVTYGEKSLEHLWGLACKNHGVARTQMKMLASRLEQGR